MNICIIGDGLTSLSLAKILINKKIKVHIYHKKSINKFSPNRTIGMSKNNLSFFEKKIIKLPKEIKWQIKKIEIYSEKMQKNKILNFEDNKKNLFYMIKNHELYKHLNISLINNKFFKKKLIKSKNSYEEILRNKNYNLIINCDQDNPISKKYFTKKFDKDYKNLAYVTIIEHERIENNSAIQVFTDVGPIAYLPISNFKTSVVCSLDIESKNYSDREVVNIINKHNPKFKIKKILKLDNFKLKQSNLRNYYYKNILAFGDVLHKIHPLAGQGFNMTIRDIKQLSDVIQEKIDLGLQLDGIIFKEFENKTKDKNYVFSSGIDLVYKIFNVEKKFKEKYLSKAMRYIGTNKKFMDTIIKYADKGLNN
jgi:2-octaprenyl-6-methoxyphenol hydroxylase